ncbi:MAG: H+-translocating transhydrogenase subunit alpha [Frankiaceae bacterium]|nr:H+-translocating transhydrogenase subunit alpha [Frankiaceae bacterium]
MQVVVLRETVEGERRVAIVPETVAALTAVGCSIAVETGAGRHAFVRDEDLAARGASVETDRTHLLQSADAVLSVQPLPVGDIAYLAAGSTVVSFLQPWAHRDAVRALAARSVTSFSLDLVPRISRAQSMDALSSQALVAGYRAVLLAAAAAPRMFPLFMTAAGTVAPAKVLVLGAGVAGLQAIATSRRLGAVVTAYDVRAAAADEVRSLGAMFLDLGLDSQEGAGGYARVQSEEFLARQREVIGEHVARSDVVITAAAVPGRPAPLLVSADMVQAMRPGGVVVDLGAEAGGAERGGNCELTRLGEVVDVDGVTILGPRNPASAHPLHASALYARNAANLLTLLIRDGQLDPDWDDEVVAGSCVTKDGEVLKT